MNIGIMSMQRVRNYGSFLQAFGLKNVIESMGHNVIFVDYKAGFSLVEKDSAIKSENIFFRSMRMLSPKYRKYRTKQIKMNRTFAEFCKTYDKEFLPQLGVKEEYVYTPELDVLIIGSDEVFNCTQEGNLVGYSLQLFGKDNNAKYLMSYAASFGTTTLQKLEEFGVSSEIAKYLKKFDAISVRDSNSANIINQLCNFKPKRNIDPVLLYEFPEVNEICISLTNYIIIYAYAGRIKEEEANVIRKFAKKKGKRILSLGFYQPFCDDYILANPLEVLAYIKKADYVITDTFHGTVFSIKYQVPFATIIRKSNQQKLSDLLSLFELEDRSVKDINSICNILEVPLNKDKILSLIKKERTSAHEYLQVNLNQM